MSRGDIFAAQEPGDMPRRVTGFRTIPGRAISQGSPNGGLERPTRDGPGLGTEVSARVRGRSDHQGMACRPAS